MRYVDAGYVVVLSILFLYGVQLAWRRRRLARAVSRAVSGSDGTPSEPSVIGRSS